MINRLKRFIAIRLGRITQEELNLEACRKNGMKVGKNCHGLAASTIDFGHCWLIEIGDNVTFAPQVYLLAHDASTKRDLDYTKIAKIVIEDRVFIGARAFIMPGVTIGKDSIVAAGSVVTKSVPEGVIVAGNPAKIISNKEDYINKHKLKMQQAYIYDYSWTIGGGITPEKRSEMSAQLNASSGYVK